MNLRKINEKKQTKRKEKQKILQINYYVKHNVNIINNIAKCTKLLFIILLYIYTYIYLYIYMYMHRYIVYTY